MEQKELTEKLANLVQEWATIIEPDVPASEETKQVHEGYLDLIAKLKELKSPWELWS